MTVCTITLARTPKQISRKAARVAILPRLQQFVHFQKAMLLTKSTFLLSRNFGQQNQTAMFQTPMAVKMHKKPKVFGTRLVQHMNWPTSNKYSVTTRSVSLIFHPTKPIGRLFVQIY